MVFCFPCELNIGLVVTVLYTLIYIVILYISDSAIKMSHGQNIPDFVKIIVYYQAISQCHRVVVIPIQCIR